MINVETQGLSWIYPTDSNFYGFHACTNTGANHERARHEAITYFNKNLESRREKYSFELDPEVTPHVENLENLGYSKIEKFFNKEQMQILRNIKEEVARCFDTNTNTKYPSKQMIYIDKPILNLPSLHELLFDDRMINIATGYYNCRPALGSVAVRKSFVNDEPPLTNQNYHRDYNSLVKMMKFVIYLNDVDEGGGPFTYVNESNKRIWNGWWQTHYPSDEMIEKLYGKDKVVPITANFGDLLMANTRGMHKGQKPSTSERTAIHFSYLIHPELCGAGHASEVPLEDRHRIRKEDFDSLPEWKKPAVDFLQKV